MHNIHVKFLNHMNTQHSNQFPQTKTKPASYSLLYNGNYIRECCLTEWIVCHLKRAELSKNGSHQYNLFTIKPNY
jgi:hypothetical protein